MFKYDGKVMVKCVQAWADKEDMAGPTILVTTRYMYIPYTYKKGDRKELKGHGAAQCNI